MTEMREARQTFRFLKIFEDVVDEVETDGGEACGEACEEIRRRVVERVLNEILKEAKQLEQYEQPQAEN